VLRVYHFHSTVSLLFALCIHCLNDLVVESQLNSWEVNAMGEPISLDDEGDDSNKRDENLHRILIDNTTTTEDK